MSFNFNSIKSGTLVSFNYTGEKDYNPKRRLVKVEKYDGLLVGGYDVLDGDQYKTFKTHSISNVKVFGTDYVLKTIQEAVNSFNKASTKAQLGGLQEVVKETVPNAESVTFDNDLQLFIVTVKAVNKSGFDVHMSVDQTGKPVKVVLNWRNREGKSYDLDFTPAQDGMLDEDRFVVALARHFGYNVVKA